MRMSIWYYQILRILKMTTEHSSSSGNSRWFACSQATRGTQIQHQGDNMPHTISFQTAARSPRLKGYTRCTMCVTHLNNNH